MMHHSSFRFVLITMIVSLPVLLLYARCLDFYAEAVLRTAAVCLRCVPLAPQIALGPNGLWGVSHGHEPNIVLAGARYSRGVFLAATILPGLLIATPWDRTTKLKMIAVASSLVVLFHLGSILSLAWAGAYVCSPRSGQLACSYLKGAFIYANQALPLAVWLFLSWRIWFPNTVVVDHK
jgi:hypothetical protein